MSKLKRLIRETLFQTRFGRNLAVKRFFTTHDKKNIEYNEGHNLYREIKDLVEKKAKTDRLSPKQQKELENDMIECFVFYHSTPQEYLALFHNKKGHKKRDSILTSIRKGLICMESMGGVDRLLELQDKYGLYQRLRPYYHRECILIDKNTPIREFAAFAQRHKDFIIKPLKGHHGDCTTIIKSPSDINALTQDMLSKSPEWIAEELVHQVEFMAQWNPSSVNTVRLPVIHNDGKFTVFHPIFRMGRKGSCVDNGAGGGLGAAIDPDTGIIISNGSDKQGKEYEKHPDSGLTIKGQQIPRWNELIELSKEILNQMDGHKYVAWDFALTDQGWVVIEGNWGEIQHYQRITGQGVYYEFRQLLLGN